MKAPVNATLALGLIAVVMIIGLEKQHDKDLDVAYNLGAENGKVLAQLEIKESLKKEVTDSVCHGWWFGGNTTQVAKSIEKVKFQ